MLLLGQALHAMEDALLGKDDAAVAALLTGETVIPAPQMPIPDADKMLRGMEVVEGMLDALDQRSNSIRDYGEEALAYFRQAASPFAAYEAASARFAEVLPQWETWLEHMLVNHMYFVQFPFQDRPIPLKDEYRTLVAVYAAAAFRLVDHTSFDLYTPSLMKELACDDWAHLRLLLAL